MTVKEAAMVTGFSETYIRSACKRGLIGEAYTGDRSRGRKKTHIVYPNMLARLTGLSVEEIERRLKDGQETE